jgi:hypothetical protein
MKFVFAVDSVEAISDISRKVCCKKAVLVSVTEATRWKESQAAMMGDNRILRVIAI